MENENNQSAVSELFSEDFPLPGTYLGVHGTSWEAIKRLMETGYFPASSDKNVPDTDHSPDRIYFFPVFPENHKEAFEEAERHARGLATVHCFMDQLGLDLSDRNLVGGFYRACAQAKEQKKIWNLEGYFDNFDAEDLYHFLQSKGITEEAMRSALNAADRREGIVIAIRKKVIGTLQIVDDDRNCGDFSIVCPKEGLAFEYIAGIDPLGDFEYDALEGLSTNE